VGRGPIRCLGGEQGLEAAIALWSRDKLGQSGAQEKSQAWRAGVLLVRTGIARAARREQMRNHRPAGVPSEPVCCVRKQVALRARCEQKSQVSLDRAAVAPSEVTIRGKEKEAPMPTRCPHDAHAPETKKTTNPATTVPARPLLRHNPSTNKVTSLFTFHSKLSTNYKRTETSSKTKKDNRKFFEATTSC
jgi:hypothetical protein